jgi:hypothetical protein
MPVAAGQTVYTTTTFRFTIPDVELDGVAVTTADTFTYTGTDANGAALSPTVSGNMTYDATTTSDWYAVITAPTAAQRMHLHAAVTKSASVGYFHDVVDVASRA